MALCSPFLPGEQQSSLPQAKHQISACAPVSPTKLGKGDHVPKEGVWCSGWARGWRILWMFNIAIHRSLHRGMKWPRTPVLICEWKKKKKNMHNVRGIWKRKRLESERKRAGNILSLLLCEKCYKFVKYSTLLPEILSYLFGRGCNWQFYCKKEEKNKKYRNCMSYHWEK